MLKLTWLKPALVRLNRNFHFEPLFRSKPNHHLPWSQPQVGWGSIDTPFPPLLP
jgi:hypothetical protein